MAGSVTLAVIAGLAVGVALLAIFLIYFPESLVHRPVFFASNFEEVVRARLSALPEVKAFHDQYGEPKVYVFAHDVLYLKTEAQITGVPYNGTKRLEPQVGLWVFIDYDTNVERMEFVCSRDQGGFKLTEGILEYLEKENCFEAQARSSNEETAVVPTTAIKPTSSGFQLELAYKNDRFEFEGTGQPKPIKFNYDINGVLEIGFDSEGPIELGLPNNFIRSGTFVDVGGVFTSNGVPLRVESYVVSDTRTSIKFTVPPEDTTVQIHIARLL